jgi:sRNA-binding carbon storage regulator CsrA
MLNLERLRGESIIFVKGDDVITVKVKNFKDGTVQLGVEAPKHLKINHKSEKMPDFRPKNNSTRKHKAAEQDFEPTPKPKTTILYKKKRVFTPPK